MSKIDFPLTGGRDLPYGLPFTLKALGAQPDAVLNTSWFRIIDEADCVARNRF